MVANWAQTAAMVGLVTIASRDDSWTLNTAVATFSMDLVARKVDHDAHIGMALMFLGAADLTLRHLLDDETS